jgi:hypothetical protein
MILTMNETNTVYKNRLSKLLRLLRLIKIAKVLKWMMGYRQKKETHVDDTDDEIGMKMSVVGRKMTESITKKGEEHLPLTLYEMHGFYLNPILFTQICFSKVILTVMLMLTVFSLLETNLTPDGRQLQLDALAINPESDILREGFFRAHQDLLRLDGVGDQFLNTKRIGELRSSEILVLKAATDDKVLASFDLSKDVFVNALFSLATTIIVTALLAILSLLFSSDAYNIMIRPIEKMKATVQKVSHWYNFTCLSLLVDPNHLTLTNQRSQYISYLRILFCI